MIQKKFLCKDFQTAESTVAQIADVVGSTPHKSAVITIYEAGLTRREIDTLVASLHACGHPELQIAGISITLIAELLPEGTGVLYNLVMTESADIEVLRIPCAPGGEETAAAQLKRRLDTLGNAKAVELFTSNMELSVTTFIEKSMEGHDDTVLFGTSTLRNLTQRISVEEDEKTIEVEKVDEGLAREEMIIGGEVLPDGFVAIIFSGDKLKVQANYALGWKPIGRKFSVGLGENSPLGETVIKEINGMPAVDIYHEYLGVYPDDYFVSNICEFPLVVERNGIDMCMIPLEHGKDGELYFMMKLRPGEQLRFTFGSHDEVLHAHRESLKKIELFQPEALFLTLCGNRISYLKEDAHLEWTGYAAAAPDYALMHGAGELFYYHGEGGILNSAHLSIGMREADLTSDGEVYEHPSLESLRRGHTLPLPDRMSTFLGKITSELIDVATQARDANKAKSAFLSHMSHEIRTPINAILGMDEMILKESKEQGIIEYADSIRSAGDNLLGIVNDVLDFSKIEAGKMNLVPTEYEILTAVKNMYNIVRLRAESKGLKIVLDIDPQVPSVLYGDFVRLNQVVTNLLTNAVKYTEEGTVTFSIKVLSTDAETDYADAYRKACPDEARPKKAVRLRIAVKDTGIGIRKEDMEALFTEFERFDEKRNVSVEGTGLGLSITKSFLDLMGSRLSVESTYGEGSEFSFEVIQGVINAEPFGSLDERLQKPVVQKKKQLRFTAEDARILVVDDTPINLLVMAKLLKHTKIKVDAVKTGEDALRLVKEHAYDVIFLDHKMPNMDGPETLHQMKELPDNLSAETPVISLTANALSNAREEYIRAGYKDYLAKPIRPNELEDMLFYYIPSEKIRTLPIDAS